MGNKKYNKRYANEYHGTVCDHKLAKHFHDVDCDYEDGVFTLFILPCMLPPVFTVRFTAPADYGLGDIVRIKEQDFAVMNQNMAPAPAQSFSEDAVVECIVDMDRKLVFHYGAATAPKSGTIPVGTPMLLAHDKDDLPEGWWFPSGEYVDIESPVGRVLNSFSERYKVNWGVQVVANTIRLYDPDKFFTNGFGRFFRPVSGSERLPGSVENDAIRNITGSVSLNSITGFVESRTTWPPELTGAFTRGDIIYTQGLDNSVKYPTTAIKMDASRIVPTAQENRPYNVGMTPAVYLGV